MPDSLQVCIDFANTVDWRNSEEPDDKLGDYPALVRWSLNEGLLLPAEAERLLKLPSEPPGKPSVLALAKDLRDAIYRLLSASARGARPDEHGLEVLNRFISTSLGRSRLANAGGRYAWTWEDPEGAPDRMLWPIARSVAELLTSAKLERIKECANSEEGCGWLFIDETKNKSRRWCSMDSCGNRVKSRKYYHLHSSAKSREGAAGHR